MEQTLFIGIDLGTSGCRAIAIDENNTIHGETTVSLPTPYREGKHVEQDPKLWWEAVCECLHTLTKSIDSSKVTAIAIDGTSASFLLTDAKGTPLTPGIMYNDARAYEQAEAITRIATTNTAAQGATCALAKLLWLQDSKEITHNTKHISFQADWISAQLSGRIGISDYNNTLKLGFDAEQKQWPNWFEKLKVPMLLLPKVVAPGTIIGNLTGHNAQHFGLPESTQIIAGTTDSTASFIATGASKPGEAVTALGSTLVLKVITDKPLFAPEYGIYSQPLITNATSSKKNLWLVGGGSNTGGSVLNKYFTLEQLQVMTPQLQPDHPTGLDYYPLPCTGERFPTNDAHLQPRLSPRPKNDIHFFQAMLEGIAKIETDGYRLLEKLGAPYPVSIRSTGGGAKNTAWTSIRKNQLNTDMIAAQNTEAAFGAALLAKHGIYKNTGK